jgi:hypothetical protein
MYDSILRAHRRATCHRFCVVGLPTSIIPFVILAAVPKSDARFLRPIAIDE